MLGRPKYPQIKVKLTGEDGNAFMILGKVAKAMRAAGLTEAQVKEYLDAATSDSYYQLMATTINYVEVE